MVSRPPDQAGAGLETLTLILISQLQLYLYKRYGQTPLNMDYHANYYTTTATTINIILGQLSLAYLRGRLIEYQLRLG